MRSQPAKRDRNGLAPGEPMVATPEFPALHAAILTVLRGYARRQPVSTNHVMQRVREMIRDPLPEEREFACLIREAAMGLELIPVYIPNHRR